MVGSRSVRSLVFVFLLCLWWGATTAACADDRLPDRPTASDLTVTEVTDSGLLELITGLDLDGPTSIPIGGRVAQVHRAATPPSSGFSAIEEWFITRPDGDTIAVAVPVIEPGPAETTSVGARVSGRGTLIGTLSATGRDGTVRSWPLYLGRFDPVTASPWSGGAASVVAATILAAGGWFLLRRRLAGSSRPSRTSGRTEAPEGSEATPGPDLPSDPADAMAILADLAEEGDSGPSDPTSTIRSER